MSGRDVGDEDWSEARPAHIPRPTAWPAGLAFGIAFLLWGLVTSPVLLAVGAGVFAVCLRGWIGELRHEEERF
jgi:hypothetical protein